MEKNCSNCGDDDGRCLGKQGNCWKPIEHKCNRCRHSLANTGIVCVGGDRQCNGYSAFEPIEPKAKAEDYKILSLFNLGGMIDDGSADDDLLWYAKNIADKGLSSTDKLKLIIKKRPEWIPYLIEFEYIQKIERVPKVNEVWKRCNRDKYLILSKEKNSDAINMWNITCGHYAIMSMNIPAEWECIGKLKDKLKE